MAKRKKKTAKKATRTKGKKNVSKKKRHPKGKKRVVRKAASKAKKRPAARKKIAKKQAAPRKMVTKIVTGAAVAAGAATAVRSAMTPEPNLRKPAGGSPRPARALDDFDTSKKDLLGGFGDEPGFTDEETSNYDAEDTEELDEDEEEEDEEEEGSFSEDLKTRKTPLTSRPYFRGEEE
jgi:hypothetical protein